MPIMYKSRKKKSGGTFLVTITPVKLTSYSNSNYVMSKSRASSTPSKQYAEIQNPTAINYICDPKNGTATTTDTTSQDVLYKGAFYHDGTSQRFATTATIMEISAVLNGSDLVVTMTMKIDTNVTGYIHNQRTSLTTSFVIPLQNGHTARYTGKSAGEQCITRVNGTTVASAADSDYHSIDVTVTKQ